LFLKLEPIPDERRRPELEFWAAFRQDQPRILGALLDAVSRGLCMLPETRLAKYQRMADFAQWVTACETAFWPDGTFLSAYDANRREVVQDVIGADLVAAAVCEFMENRQTWEGTATKLLNTLPLVPGQRVNSPNILSNRLKRVATFLGKIGIEISFDKLGHKRTRMISITRRQPS
jgi:hypothetical protein